ncbi:MAG: hydrogenase formation protein HypD [Isosphaeraceae bacterium]
MKYLRAYRDPDAARNLLDEIRRTATRPWSILDACGGQARSLLKLENDRDLPDGFEVVHGPACPVSAMPPQFIDQALSIAFREGAIVALPGDLLRVPGTQGRGSLLAARGRGADVRVVYSSLDALALARKHPDRRVLALAVGFETTAPAVASAVLEAARLGIDNLSFLTSFFRLPPAVEAILSTPRNRVRAVLAAGSVCAITGLRDFESLAERFHVPIVITGPEPLDLLDGIARAVRQLERGESRAENQYSRAARPDGNPRALATIDQVFEPSDARWRGLGLLPASGLAFRERFRPFEAQVHLSQATASTEVFSECLDGEVLSGRLKPFECPALGTLCTPDHPLGASMVATDGICAAYQRFRHPASATPEPPALTAINATVLPGG